MVGGCPLNGQPSTLSAHDSIFILTLQDPTSLSNQPQQLKGLWIIPTAQSVSQPTSPLVPLQCLAAIVRKLKTQDLNEADNEKVKLWWDGVYQ